MLRFDRLKRSNFELDRVLVFILEDCHINYLSEKGKLEMTDIKVKLRLRFIKVIAWFCTAHNKMAAVKMSM